MNNRPTPQAGELYKHYENHKTYKVLGVSFEAQDISNIENWAVDKWGTHKKTGDALPEGVVGDIAIYELMEGLVMFNGNSQLPNHIAYQSTNPLDINQITNTTTIWITPVEEFLAVLGEEPTCYYRFTKVNTGNDLWNYLLDNFKKTLHTINYRLDDITSLHEREQDTLTKLFHLYQPGMGYGEYKNFPAAISTESKNKVVVYLDKFLAEYDNSTT